MEEIKRFLSSGGDVGEVVQDPGPGEGLDFAIATFEVGISVRSWFLGLLDLCCEDSGLVILSDNFSLLLWAFVFVAIYEARYLHHDLNRVAFGLSVSLELFSMGTRPALYRLLPKESHFSG